MGRGLPGHPPPRSLRLHHQTTLGMDERALVAGLHADESPSRCTVRSYGVGSATSGSCNVTQGPDHRSRILKINLKRSIAAWNPGANPGSAVLPMRLLCTDSYPREQHGNAEYYYGDRRKNEADVNDKSDEFQIAHPEYTSKDIVHGVDVFGGKIRRDTVDDLPRFQHRRDTRNRNANHRSGDFYPHLTPTDCTTAQCCTRRTERATSRHRHATGVSNDSGRHPARLTCIAAIP